MIKLMKHLEIITILKKLEKIIIRHYYSLEEIEVEQERQVVRKLKELMELRNNHPAFNLDGDIKIQCEGSKMRITRSYNADKIVLVADLMNYEFEIQ